MALSDKPGDGNDLRTRLAQGDRLMPRMAGGSVTAPGIGVLGRRGFLAAGAGAVSAFALASCGLGTDSSNQASADGKPKRGGVLTLGVITGGQAETLIPSYDYAADFVRSRQLYDRLFDSGSDLSLKPALALSAEPNSDATVWIFKLRDGVEFHNGKKFGADDVVYTIRSWGDADSRTYGSFDKIIDYGAVRKVGALTVEVPLKRPMAQFPSLLANGGNLGITPAGVSLKELASRPVGTGPFKYESFDRGAQSTFSANREYWEHGGPYVDKLVINSGFADNDALHNALLGGQVDVQAQLTPLQAKQQESSKQITVLRAPAPNATDFNMNVQRAPFDDPRVRKALKLVADRQALVDKALLGYGNPLNDLFGEGLEYYADDLKISQDIEQAKFLLKKAGQENLTVTLSTSDFGPGILEAGTLLAQQAKQAGIKIELNKIPADQFFSSSSGYPHTFGQDYITAPFPSLTAWWQAFLVTWPNSGWDVATDSALNAAMGELNSTKANELWHEVQRRQFDEGGYLIWGTRDHLDGIGKNVKGLKPSPAGPLGGTYRLLDAWLA